MAWCCLTGVQQQQITPKPVTLREVNHQSAYSTTCQPAPITENCQLTGTQIQFAVCLPVLFFARWQPDQSKSDLLHRFFIMHPCPLQGSRRAELANSSACRTPAALTWVPGGGVHHALTVPTGGHARGQGRLDNLSTCKALADVHGSGMGARAYLGDVRAPRAHCKRGATCCSFGLWLGHQKRTAGSRMGPAHAWHEVEVCRHEQHRHAAACSTGGDGCTQDLSDRVSSGASSSGSVVSRRSLGLAGALLTAAGGKAPTAAAASAAGSENQPGTEPGTGSAAVPRQQPSLGFASRVEEFTLPTGLHVIVLPRPGGAPVVSAHIYADVGAYQEQDGATGTWTVQQQHQVVVLACQVGFPVLLHITKHGGQLSSL
jgi:hypothetical protein